MPAAKRKPGRGGARPGAGRPVTTGSSGTAPVWYRVSASERERIAAACAPGESVNAAAKRLALMALALLVGCGYQPDESRIVTPPADAARATEIVVQAFGLSYTPPVYWYDADDCEAGAIHAPNGECVFGFRRDGIIVLSTQRGLPMHETSLAHELGHAAAEEQDGNSDNACHNGRFYLDAGQRQDCKIPDDAHGLVGSANRALAAVDMGSGSV